jgi:hypothetical protein
MKFVLSSVVHKDQTSFLKNRYIGENITLFLDTQEYLSKSLKRGYAFLADWEKAYDCIERNNSGEYNRWQPHQKRKVRSN